MNDREPQPVLPRPLVVAYDLDPTFGWEDDGPGGSTLRIPPGPAWEAPLEHAGALVLSTGFMLVFGTIVVVATREQGSLVGGILALAVVMCLLAIGQWVLVLRRFGDLTRRPNGPSRVTVWAGGLEVTGAISLGPSDRSWRRADVIGLRLDEVRGGPLRRARRARLQVASRDGTVSAVVVPWPPGEPTAAHETKLRELLDLPPRATADGGAR